MTVNKNLPWKEIGNESYRVYIYESGFVYRINNPIALAVSASGGHRVYDIDDKCYYVKAGWAVIEWESSTGELEYNF